jgi:hypothetical protein
MLCVGMATIAVLTCQLHPVLSDHEHGAPPAHHHSSPSQTLGDMYCLTAVLPTLVFFTALLFVVLHLMPVLTPDILAAFPPFRPPKTIA